MDRRNTTTDRRRCCADHGEAALQRARRRFTGSSEARTKVHFYGIRLPLLVIGLSGRITINPNLTVYGIDADY